MKKNKVNLNGHNVTRILIETEEDFDLMIEDIKDSIKIAIDTENGGELALNPKYAIPTGYSLSVDGDVGYYVPVNHRDIKNSNFIKRFNEILQNKRLIIFWNSVYDGAIFTQHYNNNLEKYKWFDAMIAQHLIDARQPKGLKYNTKRYFGIEQNEFKWEDMCKTNAVDVYGYACDDAIFTFKHYLRLKEDIKEQSMSNLILNIEGDFLKVLVHLKLMGVTFDVNACKELENRLISDKEKVVNKIIEVTPKISKIKNLFGEWLLDINLDSSKDLKSLLYDRLNLPITKSTDSGAPAVDSEALSNMKNDKKEWLHPICPLLIKYKEIQKLLSAYTKSLYEKTVEGKLYCDLLDHGTEGGRLSSKNPNLQQLPKFTNKDGILKFAESCKSLNLYDFFSQFEPYNIRSLFVTSPGYKMMVADFSQEELRVAGVLTKSKVFIDAYKKGKDLHLKTANDCFNLGIPEECLVRNHNKYKYYENKFYKDRFNAKSVSFGLLYGRTAYGLAPQLGCTVEEAQKIVDLYFKNMPEIKIAKENSNREIIVRGYVENMFGRRRRFSKITKNNKTFYPPSVFREGFNHGIQSSSADILRIVMIKLYNYIKEVGNDEIRMLITVHDEIMFEIKDNEMFDEHIKKIIYIMENSVKLPIKLECEYEVGYDYGKCK